MSMRLFQIIVLVFCVGILPALAQTDTFNVQLQITGDVTAPSTPTGLAAAPVTATQIDLGWNAATDDVAIGGYQIYRDAVQVATTTLTSYSDTGLTASTTYTYFVRAFDTSYNYSSSSASAATTTPDAVVVPEEESGGGNSLYLVNFAVHPDIYSVAVSWETNIYAQFELRWGRTTSYELGFVANEPFKRSHTTVITDLEPGTKYEYQLVGFDRDGRRHVLSAKTFTTLQAPDVTPPQNVSKLQGVIDNEDIVLTWQNPNDPDFAYIRIVRSHLFHPDDPYDGFIAYQGDGEEFVDKNAFAKYQTQYYSVFSYDTNGNVSSGAIVTVTKQPISEEVAKPYPSFPLTFDDIEVIQKGMVIRDGELDAESPFLLRIAYEKLPEHLKTITVAFTHAHDPRLSFAFLLRINKDKSFYEAYIAPLDEPGEYPVTVTVYDHETKKMQQVSGSYRFSKIQSSIPSAIGSTIERIDDWILYAIALIFALLFLLFLYLLQKRENMLQGAVSALRMIVFLLLCTTILSASFVLLEGRTMQSSVIEGASFPTLYLGVFAGIALLCGIVVVAVVLLMRRK